MDLETLFTEQKWNILHHLSAGGQSPLQLAKLTNTTISNISQQLKLLEAASLVKKKKVQNRDKGKPRSVYYLSDDFAYLISLSRNFASKKFLILTNYHKNILKIWSTQNSELHELLTSSYLRLLPQISQFDCIFLLETPEKITFSMVYNGNKEAARLASSLREALAKSGKNVATAFYRHGAFDPGKFTESGANLIVLHDRENLFAAKEQAGQTA